MSVGCYNDAALQFYIVYYSTSCISDHTRSHCVYEWHCFALCFHFINLFKALSLLSKWYYCLCFLYFFRANNSCAHFCAHTYMSSSFFLNVFLDLDTMPITRIQGLGQSLLWRHMFTIHALALFIGQVVFANLAVPQPSLTYNSLEFIWDMALIQSKGNYKVEVCLVEYAWHCRIYV